MINNAITRISCIWCLGAYVVHVLAMRKWQLFGVINPGLLVEDFLFTILSSKVNYGLRALHPNTPFLSYPFLYTTLSHLAFDILRTLSRECRRTQARNEGGQTTGDRATGPSVWGIETHCRAHGGGRCWNGWFVKREKMIALVASVLSWAHMCKHWMVAFETILG